VFGTKLGFKSGWLGGEGGVGGGCGAISIVLAVSRTQGWWRRGGRGIAGMFVCMYVFFLSVGCGPAV
jgi:hypothetical protein